MRRGAYFWGSFFLLLGFLSLLANMKIIQIDIWGIFWPLVMVLLGVWVLLIPMLRKGSGFTEQVNIPLEGAGRAKIRINHGAGRFHIQGDAQPEALVNGSFGGGLRTITRRDADLLEVHLRSSENWFPGMWFPGDSLDWKFQLNNTVPIKLSLNTGASESEINLTGLQVTDLRLQTGASSTSITMPDGAGLTNVVIEAGVASVSVRIPVGVAGRIRSRSGLASVNVDKNRFPYQEGAYQSVDYATVVNKVDILIQAGLGSIEVK